MSPLRAWLIVAAIVASGCPMPPFDRVLLVPDGQPIAPLSTAVVTSRRPTLRWALPAGVEGAIVEVCRDRDCTDAVPSFPVTVMGNRYKPASDLPPGVLFWRCRLRASGVSGGWSPTWQFTVSARSATVSTSHGTVADFNSDGYADVVVGAPNADTGAGGRAYLYLGHDAAPVSDASLVIGSERAGEFGAQVGSAGDVDGDGYCDLFVTTPERAGIGEGRVYIFHGARAGALTGPPTILWEPADTETLFGERVAPVGDTNGDGYADLAVGAPLANGQGRVYVYLGSAAGLQTFSPIVLEAPDRERGQKFGWVGAGGDVNGDGYADLVVGAPALEGATGRSYVYLGGPTGIPSAPSQVLRAPDGPGGAFGAEATAAGDFNGDGYTDVLVGAPGAINQIGRVHLYPGGAAGVALTPLVSLTSSFGRGAFFGASLANAGDLDGDGFDDLVIGEHQDGNGPGRALVHRGGPMSIATAPALVLVGPRGIGSLFGWSVAGAGDVNRDGFADLLVGAVGPVRSSPGSAHLFLGGAAPSATTARPLFGPSAPGSRFGASVGR